VVIALACDAAGIEFALFDVFGDACDVVYEDVCDVAVGEVTAAFCKLAPCTLNADRNEPKNGLLVVGMLAMCADLALLFSVPLVAARSMSRPVRCSLVL
jgi:hypothetical protein